MSEQLGFIELTADNLEHEHIGCAKAAGAEGKRCSAAKKAWMRAAFPAGYRFVRLDGPGKVFIETMPAESAWSSICAEGWLFIDCFWVSGQFKGKGYGARLLAEAERQAREAGKKGLVAVTADKKRPFLSDPGFYAHHGFTVADTAPPFYRLVALPFSPAAAPPTFAESVKAPKVAAAGTAVYYTDHCPYTEKYMGLLKAVAEKRGAAFTAVKLESAAAAQNAPNPFTTWAMFQDGAFVTNEIFSPAKFEKYLAEAAP